MPYVLTIARSIQQGRSLRFSLQDRQMFEVNKLFGTCTWLLPLFLQGCTGNRPYRRIMFQNWPIRVRIISAATNTSHIIKIHQVLTRKSWPWQFLDTSLIFPQVLSLVLVLTESVDISNTPTVFEHISKNFKVCCVSYFHLSSRSFEMHPNTVFPVWYIMWMISNSK